MKTETFEEILQSLMKKLDIKRPLAYELAKLHVEYTKPHHGQWNDNT